MRFYNRQNELKLLAKLGRISKKSAQLTSIIGRRRVGKTELVKQHLSSIKRCIYFFVAEKSSASLLEEFSNELKLLFPHAPIFSDWKDFLTFLFNEAQKVPLTIVFDEFQNFSDVEPGLFSILQGLWDEWKNKTKVHLIVVGSVVGLMKRIFQDKKEPLFGRLSREIFLAPLSFESIREICVEQGYRELKDIIVLYGIFGGIPKYYVMMEDLGLGGKPTITVLKEFLFSQNAALQNEASDVIIQEFGAASSTYISIIEAVASGRTRVSEIAGPIGIPATSISKYVRELANIYGILEREVPLGEKVWRSKRGQYRIKDNFIRFWMSTVFRNYSLYEQGNYDYFLSKLDEILARFMGKAFEDITEEVLITLNKRGKLPFKFDEIGRWWWRGEEVDLIAVNRRTKELLLVEVRWRNELTDAGVLLGMKRKAELIKLDQRQVYYMIVSKSEFKASLRKLAGKNVLLWNLENIDSALSE